MPVKIQLLAAFPQRKTRLVVLTDITSLTAGLREPDDGQSLVRLLLYSCDLELEGLIASSNLGHGQRTRPELIYEVLEGYEAVQPSLLRRNPAYPSVDMLRGLVKAGQAVAGPKTPVTESIGKGKDTPASEWIIQVVDRPDERPVWFTLWGGSADLAQALWRVREDRSTEDFQAFLAKMRIVAVGDQDSTGTWIKENFPGLFYITRTFGIRGMYRGGDLRLVSPEWVDEHVRFNHGALGALYPNYDGGDIWSSRLGGVRGIKEGDTPSYLGMIPNGLNPEMVPDWGGWGGRCIPDPSGALNRWVDAVDWTVQSPDDPDRRMSAVYRWRDAFQSDFQARLDWCVAGQDGANLPPVARVTLNQPNEWITDQRIFLDATASSDPSGSPLNFQWNLYREAGSFEGNLVLHGEDRPVVEVQIPKVDRPQTAHLLLTVKNQGFPPLRSYRRIVLDFIPDCQEGGENAARRCVLPGTS